VIHFDNQLQIDFEIVITESRLENFESNLIELTPYIANCLADVDPNRQFPTREPLCQREKERNLLTSLGTIVLVMMATSALFLRSLTSDLARANYSELAKLFETDQILQSGNASDADLTLHRLQLLAHD